MNWAIANVHQISWYASLASNLDRKISYTKLLRLNVATESKDWWQGFEEHTIFMYTLVDEHYDVCQRWQFNDKQKEQLQHYYDANKLLVDCLNSDCYVSRDIRQEIEETLLLPIAEIKKRRSCRNDGVIGECNKNDEKR